MGAFNDDHHIGIEVARLLAKHGSQTIVETGALRGETTRALAGFGLPVYTIDIELGHWQGPIPDNVKRICADSGTYLPGLIPHLWPPVFYYLDAHPLVTPARSGHSPLLDELAAIGRHTSRLPVIVIHDFFNPLHPDWGFDTHDIGPYTFELIRQPLERIYGRGNFEWHYNQLMAGVACGVIFIEPLL